MYKTDNRYVQKGFTQTKILGDNMCRLRLFYYENGRWGFAEWVIPYDKDIQAHIRHWKQGVRIVTTEHIDLV